MGGGLAFDVNVYAAGDDIQRADQNNEVKVFKPDMSHALPRMQNKNIIEDGYDCERTRYFRIMPAPPFLKVQRPHRDRGQQQPERQNCPWIRLNNSMTHGRRLWMRSKARQRDSF